MSGVHGKVYVFHVSIVPILVLFVVLGGLLEDKDSLAKGLSLPNLEEFGLQISP